MKNPAHPGEFIKFEIIEALGLSVIESAKLLKVKSSTLSALLNEQARLSSDMVIRIEKVFGVSRSTLMRMQHNYDIAEAHNLAGKIELTPFSGENH